MMGYPTNTDDMIDSRDVIDAIETLRHNCFDAGEAKDFKALLDLAEEASGAPDWEYGETLIRDTYFIEYAQQLAEDIDIGNNAGWPGSFIDWDAAAAALQMDYTTIDFDGVEYWVRA